MRDARRARIVLAARSLAAAALAFAGAAALLVVTAPAASSATDTAPALDGRVERRSRPADRDRRIRSRVFDERWRRAAGCPALSAAFGAARSSR